MSTSRRQTFFMNDERAVEFGIARHLRLLGGRVRHVGGRHRRRPGASATMPLGSSMPRDSSDFFSAALSRCSRAISLSSAARSSGTILQDQPVAAHPHCARPARCGNRAARSRRRCDGRCSGCRPARAAGRFIWRRRALRQRPARSGEPDRQNQQDGADCGKTLHFGLPGEPGVRLATGFQRPSVPRFRSHHHRGKL